MQIFVADDDPVGRRLLAAQLERLGYRVDLASDGEAAWRLLSSTPQPAVAVLDWMMPGLDGVEVCRRLAAREGGPPIYVLLLTARDRETDVVEALEAGADDYVTKPAQPQELAARIRVGVRVVELRERLAQRVRELEESLARIRELQDLVPICAYCHQIRDDGDYWHSIQEYMARHGYVRFSHGICPTCMEEQWREVGPDPEPAPARDDPPPGP